MSAFFLFFFFFNDTATTEIYTLSLHDALPISTIANAGSRRSPGESTPWAATACGRGRWATTSCSRRSEEHTSELQSLAYLVCRLLLEKKKTTVVTSPSTAITRKPVAWRIAFDA